MTYGGFLEQLETKILDCVEEIALSLQCSGILNGVKLFCWETDLAKEVPLTVLDPTRKSGELCSLIQNVIQPNQSLSDTSRPAIQGRVNNYEI